MGIILTGLFNNTRARAMTTVAALMLSGQAAAELTGTLALEVALSNQHRQLQKTEALLDLQWQQELDDAYLTLITRARLDGEDALSRQDLDGDNFSAVNGYLWADQHSDIGIRELYLDTETEHVSWRLGKQQVVWGQADGLKVLDQVNPQSFREFILDDFEDARIPLWMINAEVELSDDSLLQILWIPDTSYHQMPEEGSAYRFSQPARVPVLPAEWQGQIPVTLQQVNKPDHPLKDSELGLKYSAFIDGWDISLNYLYHYNDFAVLYQHLTDNEVLIQPEYKRAHLMGGTASNAFGDFTLRAEVGLNSDSYFISRHLTLNEQQQVTGAGIRSSPELSSVLGLDYQGISDVLISGQWFQSHLTDYLSDIIRDRTEHTVSLLYEHKLANETWTLRTLWLHSLNEDDGLIRPRISWNASSNLDIWLGSDYFYGSGQGLYGQFDQQDRVFIGLELGF